MTSITVPDGKVAICVTYRKCQRSLWHHLDLASCESDGFRYDLIVILDDG